MITTGFTFCGKHSDEFGIVCDPQTRILIPAKRRTIVTIPGRSGYYINSDGTYDARVETFHCYFKKPDNVPLADQARKIAYWLSADGLLAFDNEPDKYYDAYFSAAPPQVRHLKYGEFDLEFTYSPPFAHTTQKYVISTVKSSNNGIVIPVDGTADTPCRIIIKNVGSTTIRNIKVTRQIE